MILIFDFYFLILSSFGYSNPLSFRRLNDVGIAKAETFTQMDLEGILMAKCVRENIFLSDVDKANFFGGFAHNPRDFRFQHDELMLIRKIVAHVVDIFKCEEITDALANFTLNDSSDSLASNWLFTQPMSELNDLEITRLAECQANEKESTTDIPQTKTHYFLNRLLATADRNACRPENGYRYDDDVMYFAIYFRMLAGPLAYNTIQNNLACAIPSLSTTNRHIQNSNISITEGLLRCEELLHYLENRKLPLCVALSEDATRIEGKVQYDVCTNQLIGFILPIDPDNGLPIPFTFKARSANEIVEHFSSQNPTASYVNTVMAKPLGNAPAFCLLIFGSDNKFTAREVAKRWRYIISELERLNISVLSISSDSDPRYNSAMRQNSSLGSKSNIFRGTEWFSCGSDSNAPFYIQDTTHIGTKMRNFFLKTLGGQRKLPFGNKYIITIKHLQQVKDSFSKDKHQLTETALNPFDRQNFESVLKISSPKVVELMRNHVDGSMATAMYLTIMRNFIDSFLDTKLSPLERVQKVWYSIFIVRIWREYVLRTKSLNLKDNFLTSYCFVCLELNAHSLVLLLLYLKKINKPEFFKPELLDSQQCEKFYSQLRSFTTTFSTKANCTVKEIMARINKIQLQKHIGGGMVSEFVFPKKLSSSCSENMLETTLPSKEEILTTIESSKKKAIHDAVEIGLLLNENVDIKLACKVEAYKVKKIQDIPKRSTNTKHLRQVINQKLLQLRSVSLINYADRFQDKSVSSTSPYVEILGGRKRLIVRKTSLAWLLRASSYKLSSDRLMLPAFKQCGFKKTKKKCGVEETKK